MIKSIFIINKDREVLLEKHWKTVTPRSVLDSIAEGQSKVSIYNGVNFFINLKIATSSQLFIFLAFGSSESPSCSGDSEQYNPSDR